jgi:hypothetical protein
MARQAWNREVEQDRAVLEHIRALLLALAALVDRAAGLPAVKRLHLFAVLGSGEAEARRLIVAMAFDRCPGAPAGARAALVPAAGDAGLLAARFRMLALVVQAMLAQAGSRPPHRHTAPFIGRAGRKPHRTAQSTPSPSRASRDPPLVLSTGIGTSVAIGAPLPLGMPGRWEMAREADGGCC